MPPVAARPVRATLGPETGCHGASARVDPSIVEHRADPPRHGGRRELGALQRLAERDEGPEIALGAPALEADTHLR